MARDHFRLYHSEEARDDEGREFADLAATRCDATRNARAIIPDELRAIGKIELSH
jgi:hypothetical protein